MELVFAGLSPHVLGIALAVTLFAGFVKGAVGFAMPMIMISAFSSFLPPELALAGLILPTLITNISQAFRQGRAETWATVVKYRRFLIGTVVFIGVSAPFVAAVPKTLFLLMLGLPITAFALIQLSGRSLALPIRHHEVAEWVLGIIGGLYGGLSGIWGPPLLVYLLSTGAGKVETIRAQGVVFLIGAVALLVAHLHSGIANPTSMAFSGALVVPAMIGQQLGYIAQDRLNQQRFRRWTQVLLVATGANLIRQAIGPELPQFHQTPADFGRSLERRPELRQRCPENTPRCQAARTPSAFSTTNTLQLDHVSDLAQLADRITIV